MSVHCMEEISSGCGDRVSLSIRWNKARLVVHLDPCAVESATENRLIQRYNTACIEDDYDVEEEVSQEILDAIVETGRSTFDHVAPPSTQGGPASSDLYSLLFPEVFTFRSRTRNNKLEVVLASTDCQPQEGLSDTSLANGPSPEPLHHEPQLSVANNTSLPKVAAKDIRVIQSLLGDGYIARVLVQGREMCSKVGIELREESAERELAALLKISTSPNAGIIRVPKLLGLIVRDADDERIVGFLQEYIPSPDSPEMLSSLGDIESAGSIDEARRRKWAVQVQETVHLLHQIGVTWGDGKASNVLVNFSTDDAWVIDFGGGWTEGWVEPELSGTVEGDNVAVGKILDLLEIRRGSV